MPASVTHVDLLSATVEVGEVAVLMRTGDPDFLRTLQNRYPGFLISRQQEPQITFDLEILETNFDEPDADVEVTQKNGRWMLARGDFRAEWDSAKRHCHIAQTRSPHATDSVLRIVHSLVQAGGEDSCFTPPAPFETRRRFCSLGRPVGEEFHFRVSPC